MPEAAGSQMSDYRCTPLTEPSIRVLRVGKRHLQSTDLVFCRPFPSIPLVYQGDATDPSDTVWVRHSLRNVSGETLVPFKPSTT